MADDKSRKAIQKKFLDDFIDCFMNLPITLSSGKKVTPAQIEKEFEDLGIEVRFKKREEKNG